MELEKRIKAFSELGYILRSTLAGIKNPYSDTLESLILTQERHNPWFTPDNVRKSLSGIAEKLTEENLLKWTSGYPELNGNFKPLKAAVIMAGNIPAVGFHDFLSVLISGNQLIAKTSSRDSELIEFFGEILSALNSEFRSVIFFTDGLLQGFDLVIATGSDNSSRYFEYYFGKYPHIIRKNRNSVAVLEGNETEAEIAKLGIDIFSYFGLGCRNISKIYIPEGFDITKIIPGWDSWSEIVNHSRYANNYEYNKAVFLINREKFLDTGYLLLKESQSIASPVGVLYFEFYKTASEVAGKLDLHREDIQCITGKKWIPFGTAQTPELWDYADNIDTLDFLLKKNMPGIL